MWIDRESLLARSIHRASEIDLSIAASIHRSIHPSIHPSIDLLLVALIIKVSPSILNASHMFLQKQQLLLLQSISLRHPSWPHVVPFWDAESSKFDPGQPKIRLWRPKNRLESNSTRTDEGGRNRFQWRRISSSGRSLSALRYPLAKTPSRMLRITTFSIDENVSGCALLYFLYRQSNRQSIARGSCP